MAKKAKNKTKWVWVIAYINKDYTNICGWEIEKSEQFSDVKWFIPVVRVLDKKFKGKSHFVFTPLLFNYGFFRIPKKKLKNFKYLDALKAEVSCLSGFVKNLANADRKSLRKIRKGVDEAIPIATSEQSYIDYLMRVQQANEIYSADELDRVKPGQTIVLKEYPFAGLAAKVLRIDFDKRKVMVSLCEEAGMLAGPLLTNVELDFEHVFFTIYKSTTDEDLMGHISLDEVGSYNKSHKMFKDETE